MKAKLVLSAALVGAGIFATSAHAAEKEVTIWSWFVNSTMQKSIDAFEKTHPDIKVKYTYYILSPEYLTTLKAASASGSLPDIIGLFPGSLTQQYRNDLVPLNDRAAKEWGKDLRNPLIFLSHKTQLEVAFVESISRYGSLEMEVCNHFESGMAARTGRRGWFKPTNCTARLQFSPAFALSSK